MGIFCQFSAPQVDGKTWNPFLINEINKTSREAQIAYQSEDYKAAARAFRYLLNSIGLNQDAVALNLAHSYFNLQDTAAIIYYNQVHKSQTPQVKSLANLQLGVMKASHQPQHVQGQDAAKVQEQQIRQALNHFKDALRANPNNVAARHNYELLKRLLEQHKNQQQNQQSDQNQKDQNQQQDSQQNKQDNDEQQEAKEADDETNPDESQQGNNSTEGKEMKTAEDQLKELNISPEKAQMILDAMKNNEVQYLQQSKRKSLTPKDPTKPDW
jgi:Ca-activated chloride channel homolog